jgi:hypothetical protein
VSAEANKKSPRRRRWWILIAVAAVVCLTTAVLVHIFRRDAPLNRLKQQVCREVPVGSTRAQVEAWAKTRLNGQIPTLITEPLPDDSPGSSWRELAGVPRDQRGTVLMVTVPCGWYTVPVHGEVAQNQLWAFFPLNGQGEVTGQYFLTLEDLAKLGR